MSPLSGRPRTARRSCSATATARSLRTSTSPESVGQFPEGAIAGDFDLDGKTDLAVSNSTSGNATILKGAGDGDFTSVATSPEQLGSNPRYITRGDFNADGRPDLTASNLSGGNVTVLMGVATWTGGGADNNWSTPANWAGNAAPGNGSHVTINTDGNNPTNYDLAGEVSLASVTLENGAVDDALTVSGNPVKLAAGGYITNNRTGANTTQLGSVALGGATTITQAASSSALSVAGVISGGGSLVKAGTGTLTVAGANTYSGGTTVSAGTLVGDTTSLQGDIAKQRRRRLRPAASPPVLTAA